MPAGGHQRKPRSSRRDWTADGETRNIGEQQESKRHMSNGRSTSVGRSANNHQPALRGSSSRQQQTGRASSNSRRRLGGEENRRYLYDNDNDTTFDGLTYGGDTSTKLVEDCALNSDDETPLTYHSLAQSSVDDTYTAADTYVTHDEGSYDDISYDSRMYSRSRSRPRSRRRGGAGGDVGVVDRSILHDIGLRNSGTGSSRRSRDRDDSHGRKGRIDRSPTHHHSISNRTREEGHHSSSRKSSRRRHREYRTSTSRGRSRHPDPLITPEMISSLSNSVSTTLQSGFAQTFEMVKTASTATSSALYVASQEVSRNLPSTDEVADKITELADAGENIITRVGSGARYGDAGDSAVGASSNHQLYRQMDFLGNDHTQYNLQQLKQPIENIQSTQRQQQQIQQQMQMQMQQHMQMQQEHQQYQASVPRSSKATAGESANLSNLCPSSASPLCMAVNDCAPRPNAETMDDTPLARQAQEHNIIASNGSNISAITPDYGGRLPQQNNDKNILNDAPHLNLRFPSSAIPEQGKISSRMGLDLNVADVSKVSETPDLERAGTGRGSSTLAGSLNDGGETSASMEEIDGVAHTENELDGEDQAQMANSNYAPAVGAQGGTETSSSNGVTALETLLTSSDTHPGEEDIIEEQVRKALVTSGDEAGHAKAHVNERSENLESLRIISSLRLQLENVNQTALLAQRGWDDARASLERERLETTKLHHEVDLLRNERYEKSTEIQSLLEENTRLREQNEEFKEIFANMQQKEQSEETQEDVDQQDASVGSKSGHSLEDASEDNYQSRTVQNLPMSPKSMSSGSEETKARIRAERKARKSGKDQDQLNPVGGNNVERPKSRGRSSRTVDDNQRALGYDRSDIDPLPFEAAGTTKQDLPPVCTHKEHTPEKEATGRSSPPTPTGRAVAVTPCPSPTRNMCSSNGREVLGSIRAAPDEIITPPRLFPNDLTASNDSHVVMKYVGPRLKVPDDNFEEAQFDAAYLTLKDANHRARYTFFCLNAMGREVEDLLDDPAVNVGTTDGGGTTRLSSSPWGERLKLTYKYKDWDGKKMIWKVWVVPAVPSTANDERKERRVVEGPKVVKQDADGSVVRMLV